MKENIKLKYAGLIVKLLKKRKQLLVTVVQIANIKTNFHLENSPPLDWKIKPFKRF